MNGYGIPVNDSVVHDYCEYNKVRKKDILYVIQWDHRLLKIEFVNGETLYYDSFENVGIIRVTDEFRKSLNKTNVMFSTLLKWTLKRRFMTNKEFAKRLNVTGALISQYTRGKSLPNVERLVDISKVLRVPVEAFLEAWEI